jgi:hypothetical protein
VTIPKFDLLPVDPRTGEPLPPRAQPGYYPGYSVLKQKWHWDEATRDVVLARVERIPPLRFFTANEAPLMSAIFNRLLPQDDRDLVHRIPILPFVDERLFLGKGQGYRFEQMPRDPEAYRLGMEGVEAMADKRHRQSFVQLAPTEQDELLKSLHDGKANPHVPIWDKLPPPRLFQLFLSDALESYYSHPWAWDEIGFGGPAYPRGYMRLERGEPEPWEAEEQRYLWEAPPSARSARNEAVASADQHLGGPGQGGTH